MTNYTHSSHRSTSTPAGGERSRTAASRPVTHRTQRDVARELPGYPTSGRAGFAVGILAGTYGTAA